jgi:hypothetical protein
MLHGHKYIDNACGANCHPICGRNNAVQRCHSRADLQMGKSKLEMVVQPRYSTNETEKFEDNTKPGNLEHHQLQKPPPHWWGEASSIFDPWQVYIHLPMQHWLERKSVQMMAALPGVVTYQNPTSNPTSDWMHFGFQALTSLFCGHWMDLSIQIKC